MNIKHNFLFFVFHLGFSLSSVYLIAMSPFKEVMHGVVTKLSFYIRCARLRNGITSDFYEEANLFHEI